MSTIWTTFWIDGAKLNSDFVCYDTYQEALTANFKKPHDPYVFILVRMEKGSRRIINVVFFNQYFFETVDVQYWEERIHQAEKEDYEKVFIDGRLRLKQ